MKELVCLAIFVILSALFAIAMIVAGFLCQYKKENSVKESTYECGIVPFSDARVKFDVRYFNYAVLFLIFDIETIFLYPFALSFNSLGLFAVIEVFLFVLILLFGLVFAIKKENVEVDIMNVVVTSIDYVLNWSRANSLWPLTFATSCCGIEMMQTVASNNDIARFGSEIFRGSPRQADLLICAGTITHKMAPALLRLYEQMPEPKYVIAMGACTCGGGMFAETSYSVVKGVDKIIPVDIYLPMCPPKPESLLDAIRQLQKDIKKESILTRKDFVEKHSSSLKESCGLLVEEEINVIRLGVE